MAAEVRMPSLLRVLLLAALLTWPSADGWTGQAASAPLSGAEMALHALDRLAYGPRPGDLTRVTAMGVERWLEEQLNPHALPYPAELSVALKGLDTLELTPAQLFSAFGPPFIKRAGDPEAQKEARRQANRVALEAQQARVLRAWLSPRQLQEVMVEFWFDHFNVFAGKGLCRIWIGAYEREAIRPHALGRFRDLLGATARHPAMLFYLDNWLNTAPGSRGARGRFKGLNENYARELLELHTLGVDGGYTQQDVVELARILTGWGLTRNMGRDGAAFRFDPARHDDGSKRLLGVTFSDGGQAEGEAALDLLARHPSTARHVCRKLAMRLVSDTPDPTLVDRMARTFQATDGDIAAVLRTLFQSPEFWSRTAYRAKYKPPYRFLVSLVRAAGLPPGDGRLALGLAYRMGQPVHGCQTPDGWKDTRAAWLNSAGLLQRIDLVKQIAARPLLTRPPADGPGAGQPLAQRLKTTLGPALSARALSASAAAGGEPLASAALLGGPDFMVH